MDVVVGVFAILAMAAPVVAGVDAGLLRYPDVSDSHIAFVYAGDIWTAPKSGGDAVRLSTPAGEEVFPRFSPDGKEIAFGGNYDGNADLYVMPTAGGVPTRLTHHPMNDRMLDWYPDGKSILYSTSMNSGKQRFNQLYRLSKKGGLPEKLPVPYGEFGTVAADGKTLAYMPVTRDFRTWKRYRGGSMTDIWTFDLESRTSKNVTDFAANDAQPMWHGKTLYFISDRGSATRYNLWAWNSESGDLRQITRFKEFDVRFPAIGPSDLVFENGGSLYLMSLSDEKYKSIEIDVVTDRATLKPRAVPVAGLMRSADISPSGKRALVGARGEVFTVPKEHGVIRNLTRSSGVAERSPAWSPDGAEIAYWSDRSGEYELTIRPSDGSGQEERLTRLGPGFRYGVNWSPDSRKVAYIDQAMKIWIYDRDKKKPILVDQALYFMHGALAGFSVSWSSDSRWMAYHRDLDTRMRAVFLYDTTSGESHQVTAGFYDCSNPVFDPDGKYLYLQTARNWNPVYSDLDTTWVYNNMTGIGAVPLRKDVPSPLAPRNDEEEIEKDSDKEDDEASDEKGDNEDEGAEDDEDDEKKPDPVEIDLDGFERRLVMLPAETGNYGQMGAVSGKVIYQRGPRTGSGGNASPIVYWDLEEREEATIIGDADFFVISADGKSMLLGSDGAAAIVDVGKDQKMDKALALADLEMQLDPMAEWKQIFNDAWRIERDFFYDPAMHGQDWDEMRRRYGALVDDAVTRWDLDFILGELIGELNASHSYKGGGDMEQPRRRNVGLLGCDYELHDGAYRIAKIVEAAIWDTEVRSPLSEPGVDVQQGDYLLAVNGVPLDTSKDPWAAFQGLAGKTVMLTVNDKPSMEDAREVLVETLGDETRLRNLAWIESNRRYVEEKTNGRVGYAYVPSTGIDGQTELRRMFAPQFTKDALIIDERFNNGGQIPTRFIEMLNRPITNYWGVRDGKDWQWPPASHVGPKAMLINQWSGSGGDCFPYYFRKAGLGPLIGKTTWGGLIGISGAPGLIDGGVVTVPTFSFYDTDGEWAVENTGVAPDIEVVDDPALMTDGGDPQLDRAIREMLDALEGAGPQHPKRPKNPDRSGH
jgi:tricorn protease